MSHSNSQSRIRVILKGKPSREYQSDRLIVGRSDKADFQILSDNISRQHLEVFIQDGGLWIKDLGSNNGTYVDNTRIPANKPIRCRNVQTLRLGENALMQIALLNFQTTSKEISNVSAIEAKKTPEPEITLETLSKIHLTTPPLTVKPNPVPAFAPPLKVQTQGFMAPPKIDERSFSEIPAEGQDDASAELETKEDSILLSIEPAPSPLESPMEEEGSHSIEPFPTVEPPPLQTPHPIEPKEKTLVWDKNETLATENQKLREVINNLTSELNDALEQKHQSPEETKKREAALSAINERVHALQTELESVRGNRDEEIKKFEAWKEEKKIEMKRAELDSKAQLHEKEIEKANLLLSIKELASKKALAEKEIQVLEKALDTLAQEEQSLRAQGKQIASTVKQTEHSLEAVKKQERTALQNVKEAQTKLEELLAQFETKETELKSIKETRQQVLAEIETLKASTEDVQQSIAEEKKRLMDEAREAAQSIRQIAVSEGKELIHRMKEEATEEITQRKLDAAKQLEEEMKDQRKKTEEEIRHRMQEAAKEFEERREENEREARQWQKARIKAVTAQIEASLTTALETVLKRHGEAKQLPFLLRSVRPVVETAFTAPLPGGPQKNAGKFGHFLHDHKKAITASLGTAMTAIAFFVLMDNRVFLHRYFRSTHPKTAKSESNLASPRELASQTEFKTDQDAEYKSNYVDNVMYTAFYLDIKLDEQLQKRWVVELNHYFSTNLHLDETAMVNYFTAETTLIHKLATMRDSLKTKYDKDILAQMRATEEAAVHELVELAGGKINYHLARGLERSFFQKVLQERATASATPPTPAPESAKTPPVSTLPTK